MTKVEKLDNLNLPKEEWAILKPDHVIMFDNRNKVNEIIDYINKED